VKKYLTTILKLLKLLKRIKLPFKPRSEKNGVWKKVKSKIKNV